ncbi:hypothetical protein GM415_14700 [Pseudodesulfovibrio cashew]|uniref:Uncharacterized protein n=1 Tax=Pseudodesulfovibrio cashew TaxID=2678688 RepID=A0A6I6JLZ8_9BACT|nr:hypothetical protein [Pseudodesulfovibrio cashew]QGY41322.1 hypothetical protein GM415_14700 [Pseudodesulfovibrio cashew]
MSDLKDFADQLQQDVVADMAESYFGHRKDLDNMIEGFQLMVEDFRKIGPKLSLAAARLHALLLDRTTARNFYIALDILPSCIPFPEGEVVPFLESIPFALTVRGRYERCVCMAYERFQKIADEYLNGRYYPDPDQTGRKRLTVHYIRLKALAEHINEKVDQVNRVMSPSETLRYVKAMDPELAEKELFIGESCRLDECSLDEDLKFKPLDFDGLGLPVVQDLPRLAEVKPAIRDFCWQMFPGRVDEVRSVLQRMLVGSE